MNKITLLLCALCLAAASAFPAIALDSLHNEIVYRTNLGRADDVALLLKQGIAANAKNDDGVPLLALAAARKDREGLNILQVLLSAGADPDESDAQGQTALFYAVKQGNMEIVKYLLAKGANYYALDTNGDTARNIAYTTGHKDIGVAIDNFVKTQTNERARQYLEFNKIMEERFRPPPQADIPAHTEHNTAGKAPEPAPPPVEPSKSLTPEEEQAAKEAWQIEQKRRQEDIKRLATALAFNTCAFEYWSYCSTAGQRTELSPEALDNTIDTHKDNIAQLEDELAKGYNQSRPVISKISDSAKQRIFNELNAMPSKAYRHEEGVGKMDDMQMRCQAVARKWDIDPPGITQPERKRTQVK